MNRKTVALLVFSRTPVEGQVKTRLIPVWGTQGALILYKDMIKKTLETAVAADVEDTYLYCTPDKEHPFIQFCSTHYEVGLALQSGENLGEKMLNAFSDKLDSYRHVVIIGCDCPGISHHDINLAMKKLSDGVDVVLGPSEDGGYYLIGLSDAHAGLFENINWGTSDVLEQTREHISRLQLTCFELPVKWDMDRPEDVDRYMETG